MGKILKRGMNDQKILSHQEENLDQTVRSFCAGSEHHHRLEGMFEKLTSEIYMEVS